MKKILTLFCVFGLTSALEAQTASDLGGPAQLPPGPLIQTRAPDFAEWVVTQKTGSIDDTPSRPHTPSAGQDATASESTEDTITKTHDVIRVVRVNTASRPWTIWCHGALEYMIWPDGKSCGQITPGSKDLAPNPFYIDFSHSDFLGFEWISPKSYTSIKSYQGIKCIVFQTATSPQNDSGAQTTSVKKKAYIDFKTRLPVALQIGDEQYLYVWNAPPQAMLSFPSMVQTLMDAGAKNQQEMAQRAVRPW